MGGVSAAWVSLQPEISALSSPFPAQLPCHDVGIGKGTWKLGPGPHQVAPGLLVVTTLVTGVFPIQDSPISGMGAAKTLEPAVCLLS